MSTVSSVGFLSRYAAGIFPGKDPAGIPVSAGNLGEIPVPILQGKDFRSAYDNLGEVRAFLLPKLHLMALTATITETKPGIYSQKTFNG